MMQQLLIDRFRGLFLGVAVLEAHLRERCKANVDNDAADNSEYVSPREPLGWCEAMALGQSEIIAYSTQSLNGSQVPFSVTHSPDDENGLARLIARVLPAALFYHDNLPRLEDYICDHVLEGASPSYQAEIWSIGVAIALLCKEQANPYTLIPQLLAQEFLAGTDLQGQLQQVQTQLKTQASLSVAWNEVNPEQSSTALPLKTAFAMACYCWSSTADTFALTVQRTLTLPLSPGIPALMTAALSGVSNGLPGIPLDWQTPLLTPSTSVSRASILALADRLLGAWSGYFTYETWPTSCQLEQTAVSAPGVLRPRD